MIGDSMFKNVNGFKLTGMVDHRSIVKNVIFHPQKYLA